jgi:nucleoside-diphosphate-sugar epimerase
MSSLQAAAYRRQYGFNAIVLVPGNLYGPYDNFDLKNSHVIPALIRKVHEAKRNGADEIVMWGSGKPVRDFVYVKDACDAILLAAEKYNGSDLINLSSGVPVTIKELVDTVVALCGYQGRVRWDSSKPDGQMLKGFDVTRMREWLRYEPPTSLREGLRHTIAWLEANYATARLEAGG